MKRGQVSIFIIMILVIIIFSYQLLHISGKKDNETLKTSINVQDGREIVINYVGKCMSDLFSRTSFYLGVSENSEFYYKTYFNRNIMACLNIGRVKELGYTYKIGLPDTEVEITDYLISFKLNLNATLTKEGESAYFKEFFYTVNKLSKEIIELDESGKSIKDEQIVSSDRAFILFINKGTRIISPSGGSEPEISIFMYSDIKNDTSLGKTSYLLGPSGTQFIPEAEFFIMVPEGLLSFIRSPVVMNLCYEADGKCIMPELKKDEKRNILIGKINYIN